MPAQSPSQTVGPFFHDSLVRGRDNVLVTDRARGARIRITGQVLDGDGAPIPDALLEIWQADAAGIYPHPADPGQANADPEFAGFGRCATDGQGRFEFKTVKPGPTRDQQGRTLAPQVNVRIFMRGLLIHAVTRLYFADEPANERDPVLAGLVPAERRQTLLARPEEGPDLPTYRFDIRMQGAGETVFFDI